MRMQAGMSKSGGSCPLAASKVSADVQRTVDAVDAAKEGVPRPLSDEETESRVLAGRLPGLGAGTPGPLHRMGEANAAGGLLDSSLETLSPRTGKLRCVACSRGKML